MLNRDSRGESMTIMKGRRGAPARVGVSVAVPVLLLAALFLFQQRANARSLIVVPVTPLGGVAEPLEAPSDSSPAVIFLASMRGTNPVACALAARSLSNHE